MTTTKLSVSLGDLQGDARQTKIMPRLLGKVFHCTSGSGLEGILSTGAIVPNDGSRESRFGSNGSYFRKRGCVSLFDYRTASPDQIEESIMKCYPFDTTRLSPEVAILFLSPPAYDSLIPWTKSREEGSWEKIVPYVEAGHPGAISISSIEELLLLTVEWSAEKTCAEQMLEALATRNKQGPSK